MRNRLICLLALSAALGLAGCAGKKPHPLHPAARPYVPPPGTHTSPYAGWYKPGSYEQYRLNQAETFDPYPDNKLGPEIVGGRPPGFQKPRNEVMRSQWWNPISWFKKH